MHTHIPEIIQWSTLSAMTRVVLDSKAAPYNPSLLTELAIVHFVAVTSGYNTIAPHNAEKAGILAKTEWHIPVAFTVLTGRAGSPSLEILSKGKLKSS